MKKNLNHKWQNISISSRLLLFFIIIFGILSVVLYNIIPIILNYPPGAINSEFDREVSILYYKYQFLLVVFGIILFVALYLKIALRDVDRWWKNRSTAPDTIKKIRKKALSFPFSLYIYMEIFPTCLLLIILALTGSHPEILMFKLGTIIFSFSTLVASIFFILTKKIFYSVLVYTSEYCDTNVMSKNNKSLKFKLIFQLFPTVLVTALILCLVGYYRLTIEKGSLFNNYYRSSLNTELDSISQDPSIDNIYNLLNEYFYDDSAFCFVENPDGSIQTSNGTELSHFFVKYMHDLAETHNNTVYETYTIDSQAVIQKINYTGGTYTVGIYYEISSFSTFLLLFIIALLLFIFSILSIYYSASSLVSDIRNVSKGLHAIIDSKDSRIGAGSRLPITSDDELGELESALNKVQDLNNNHIAQIQENQNMLMEKERLASLGQLIGGISHNLKTPIMSISGAAEGLTDLINEYDKSIGDSEVTIDDHHAIANDMRDWIAKIHEYTAYMSDIITAVKGQAVVLSENQTDSFTIDELFKRVNILMKHELKKASLIFDVKIQTSPNTVLKGDINSLVQVINNLVTNAIQSYNGEKNKTVTLSAKQVDNNLVISVADNGCGIPEDVQEKIFNSMVTTKGKNGTGLGLFMSYSTIRGHFNGDLTFTSKIGKGTTFKITIPLSNK